MPGTRVALVGLPGSGKSTVGHQLARRLQLPFVDTDKVLEERIGCSIRAFFEQQGETAFRDIEEEVVGEVLGWDPSVVATGGGAVLRPANRHRLRQGCCVIYLHSSPENLYQRLRNDQHRPLLQVADPLARLKGLYADRHSLYREAAHHVVETNRSRVGGIVNAILVLLESEAGRSLSAGSD